MSDAAELTARQQQAIAALLSTASTQAAARKAKVPSSTLYVWLNEPAFKREFRRAQTFVFEQSLAVIVDLTKDAVAALKRNLRCKVPAVEVKAALGVLDKALSGRALADMAAEIAELRAALEGDDDADARGGEVATLPAAGGGEGGAGDQGGVDPPPLAGPPAVGPGAGVPGGGADPRPVAGGVPLGPGEAAADALLPPGGEESDQRGEDVGPLFD